MAEQIYIGNFAKGLTTNRLPFVIDNDAFPTMYNFYSWRGRAKRKRGTIFLGQLQLQEQIGTANWQEATFDLVAGAGNLITQYGLGSTASIAPGTINLIVAGDQTYTDPLQNGTLHGSTTGPGAGTINYATGAFVAGGTNGAVTGTFSYFSGLPVMGLEDFAYSSPGLPNVPTTYPVLLAFDTKFAYQCNQAPGNAKFYNVSYYKQTNNPVIWSGADYQQFWTTNYQSALWATNNNPGFHFVNGTYTSGSGTTTITFNFQSLAANYTTLVIGDKLWFNEWNADGVTINGQTGTVSGIGGAAGGNYVVTFTGNQTVSGTGIAQLLTSSIAGQDGIRWYDRDPTGGTGIPSVTTVGWANFAPPLTASNVSIDDKPAALYYLVGALAIVPFKDRLVFFSPWIKTSSGNPIQLIDTALWSWNGTPYYANLTPVNETNNIKAYYQDQTGLGGNLPAGIAQPIATVSNNEDVLIVGFGGRGRKTRFVYTSNDYQPFLWYTINSELPSDSTFSSVVMDKGALDIGAYGIAMTDQQSAQRIDLEIPDSVFQIQGLNNGVQRVNAIRDFYKEWVYFSYPVNSSTYRFPTQTLLYNYRDVTWAVLYENFTHHGTYLPQTKRTWLTTGFKSWNAWREPWNGGSTSPLIPNIIAGNPQGYVLTIGEGTGEAPSGTILAITSTLGNAQINSIDHCVQVGDYLLITGGLGITAINNQIGKVITVVDNNNFVVDIAFPAGTYLGLGKFTRLSQPLLQTKQFMPYWDQGRQCRLSVQKYLMDYTANAQVTVNVNLSQDPDDVWNGPGDNPSPNSLVYSQIMYTCPESVNVGLTPANVNLQNPLVNSFGSSGQYQIWHRFGTSLIGDSVQIGITLSDAQMRNLTYATDEITLHGMHLTVDRGPQLA
jgi:hypothetical protein